jgi:hypothetical protein
MREIWRYLLGVDLVRTLKASRRLPYDHPLFASRGRAAATRHYRSGDGLWLRVVDAAAALEGRTYGIDGRGSGRLTLDLRDEYCPWNAGRWSVEVEAGRARVARTEADADLELDANDLASLFLGGFTATALASAGRVVELEDGQSGRGGWPLPGGVKALVPAGVLGGDEDRSERTCRCVSEDRSHQQRHAPSELGGIVRSVRRVQA